MDGKLNYWLVPALADRRVINNSYAAEVIRAAGSWYSVDVTERTRRRDVCDTRNVVCYVLRRSTDLSTTKIGNMLHLDHATVIHGSAQAEMLLNCDKQYRRKYQTFVDEFAGTKLLEYEKNKNL